MGTQGPGRKRIPNRERLTAEDDALNQIAREAEARLAAKRAARAEAREIRMKELERQQKELFHSHKKYYGLDNKWGHIEQWMEDSERYSRPSRRHASVSDDEERMSVGSRGSLRVEERPDRDFTDKGSRTASTLSATTLASLGGASSRRGSCDTTFSVETEASIREMKDTLAEAEERYRRAMLSNAQLHNEKATLMYQVDALREELSDMEEGLWEARRHCDDTAKELQCERQSHLVLQFQFKEMKETLSQTEELLKEVSELRLKSSSYCQEVCDLQEALQWKEKKIVALERHRKMSDLVQVERDRLRDEVISLRESLQKHGVTSPEVSTNGEAEQGGADNDSRLSQDTGHGGRESMLGRVQGRSSVAGIKLKSRAWCGRQMLTEDRVSRETGGLGRNRKPQRHGQGEEVIRGGRWDLDQLERKVEPRVTGPRCAEAPSSVEDNTPTGQTTGRSNGAGLRLHVCSEKRGSNPLCSCWPEVQNVVPPVHTKKVLKSRLVPPRPSKDIILDNVAAARLTSLTAEKPQDLTSCQGKAGRHQGFHHQERTNKGGRTDSEGRVDRGERMDRGRRMDRGGRTNRGGRKDGWHPPDSVMPRQEEQRLAEDGDQDYDEKSLEEVDKNLTGETPGLSHKSLRKITAEEEEEKEEEEEETSVSSAGRRPGTLKGLERQRTDDVSSEHPKGKEDHSVVLTAASVHRKLLKGRIDLRGFAVAEIPESFSCRIWDLESLQKATGSQGQADPEPLNQNLRPLVFAIDSRARGTEDIEGSIAGHEDIQGQDPRPTGNTLQVTSGRQTGSSEDFVFVESYFAEPVQIKTDGYSDEASADLRTGRSDDDDDDDDEDHLVIEVDGGMKEQRQVIDQGPSRLIASVEDTKDTQLKRHRAMSTTSPSHHRSKVRCLIQMTAEELKAMAVPEFALIHLREGRRTEASPGSNAQEDMDSCEEADENGECPPEAEDGDIPMRTSSAVPQNRKDDRKYKTRTDCRVS